MYKRLNIKINSFQFGIFKGNLLMHYKLHYNMLN